MKAIAAAAPARLRPAWRTEAAPVASGSLEVVELPVAEGRSELGRVMGLVGWMTVELPAGAPVLGIGVGLAE